MFDTAGLTSWGLTSWKEPDARRRRSHDERLASAVSASAVLAALIVAAAVPAAYLWSAHDRLMGVLEARAQGYAGQVSEAASENPLLRNAFLRAGDIDLEGLRIAAPDDPDAQPEQRRVIAGDGHAILDIPPAQPLAWPVLQAREPVMQQGHRLGEVEIRRSLQRRVSTTAFIAACSLAVGLLLMAVLRMVPLRLMRQALDRASFLSGHDQLTGLPNRALMADRLSQALAAEQRSGAHVAVLSLDLDHFKEVNDTLGHAAGDALLRAVASKLAACLRSADTLARLGGDEFLIILPNLRQPHEAGSLASRLIESVREPVSLGDQQVFVGLSVGISLSAPGASADDLVNQADTALYQAKGSGRGCFCFFAPEMNARLQFRRALENDLRAALAHRELAVYYQPQVDLASGTITGAEALVRWTRHGVGVVPPSDFLPLAEETGLIGPLGAWVLDEACREAVSWPESMHVSVNVSPVQFRLGLLDKVRSALERSGLPPGRLELEVTETILLSETEKTIEDLAELRALGVRLTMDDFGTGYASLGYLQKFHFDKIKIDRSFIRNLGRDSNAAAIVCAVMGLSDALGMVTNAEGVETDEQITLLREHGCREVQGFRYWGPMPSDALRKVLAPEVHPA